LTLDKEKEGLFMIFYLYLIQHFIAITVIVLGFVCIT